MYSLINNKRLFSEFSEAPSTLHGMSALDYGSCGRAQSTELKIASEPGESNSRGGSLKRAGTWLALGTSAQTARASLFKDSRTLSLDDITLSAARFTYPLTQDLAYPPHTLPVSNVFGRRLTSSVEIQ
nr:hypothetical protein CFP56_09826 [Quercus suber]